MKRTKLISLRVDETTLYCIDAYAEQYDYLSRSKVINNFLHAMLFCCASDGTARIATSYDPYDDGFVVGVTKKRK